MRRVDNEIRSILAKHSAKNGVVEKRFGVPTQDQMSHRIVRAPENPPQFGEAPEDFHDEVVWVEADDFQGIAYCDDEGVVGEGQNAGHECYIYINEPLISTCYIVNSNQLRLATKDEVRSWFERMMQKRRKG